MVDLRRVPRSTDNRHFYAPSMFPVNNMAQFTGASDNITNGTEGDGDLIAVTSTTQETVDLYAQFLTKFRLAGGAASWDNAVVGDWVSFSMIAPATAGTSNPGSGVYDKYQVGAGTYMYTPNATQSGDWDLNLSEKLNANVDFTKVVPVPSSSQTGFFDWDLDTGAVTLNAGQTGRYNLFDFQINLRTFVQRVPLVGTSAQMFTVPAIKPYLCLPHWKIHLKVNNSTSKTLKFGAFIYRGLE